MKDIERVVHQHGDLLLVREDAVPEGAVPVKTTGSRYVIERGEGVHTHTLEAPLGALADKVSLYEKDGVLYAKVKEPVELNHEEHGKQTVMPGVYRKRIEQVIDYETDTPRRVMD